MPRPRKTTKQPEFSLLSISVDDYRVRTSAGINTELLSSWRSTLDDDEPIYTYETTMELRGTCTSPENRAGDRYEISLLSKSESSADLRLKVKDLHQ